MISDDPDNSALAKSLTLAAMSLGFGVVQLDVTIVNTTLNSIAATLGGGVPELQWIVSAYTITFAALILPAGALGDRLGSRRVFMWGFGVFTAASLACALAPQFHGSDLGAGYAGRRRRVSRSKLARHCARRELLDFSGASFSPSAPAWDCWFRR